MKLGIMQPYIFPYIGYFHLIDSVDTFVFYDDVNFVNSGWVNRNKILINNKEFLFTVPSDWSQNKKINEVLVTKEHIKWRNKFFSTLKHSYGKEKYFKECMNLIELSFDKTDNLGEICKSSIKNTLKYLEVEKNIIDSSSIFLNDHLKSDLRIKDICKKMNASHYINTIGGKDLYSKEQFKNENIDLYFIKTKENLKYLSIIDTIMKNGKNTIKHFKEYELV